MGDTAALVEARDVVFRAEAARLLDRVCLKADKGELIGVIGPNGAGKSTLLRTLAGLLRQQEGSVLLGGQDLAAVATRDVARQVALVPQAAPQANGFTCLEVVLMGRYPHLGRFQVEGSADRQIARESMRLTETAHLEERPLSTLSGGERQRVIVARALAQAPQLLLLDEPTSNLDVLYQLKTLDLVRDLVAQGVTAIAAIHDLHLASRYCDRLVLLSGGRVIADGAPCEVLTPKNLQAAFHVRAAIYPDPLTGALTVSLLGPAKGASETGGGPRVHVVCGGGSGARTMYALRERGFSVTAGPLGSGDTDRSAAEMLGVEYVPMPAFGAIDDDAHSRHLALVRAAHCSLLCDMPFGANNVRSLEALLCAPLVVCIEGAPLAARDFTGGRASRLYESLAPVRRCRIAGEAVAAVEAAIAGSKQ